jgi:hypothetical protein
MSQALPLFGTYIARRRRVDTVCILPKTYKCGKYFVSPKGLWMLPGHLGPQNGGNIGTDGDFRPFAARVSR